MNKIMLRAVLLIGAGAAVSLYAADPASPYYSAEGDAIVRHNGTRYNNRPLYAGAAAVFPLAGDRPFLRLVRGGHMHGCFMVALVRDGRGKWLNDCGDVTARYRPGRMEWMVKDESFGATELHFQAVAVPEPAGMAMRLRGQGVRPGDQLVWAYGSGKNVDRLGSFEPGAKTVGVSFVPDECRGTELRVDGECFTLRLPADKRNPPVASGRCSRTSRPVLADAESWRDPVALAHSTAKELPVVCGTVAIQNGEDLFWTVALTTNGVPVADVPALQPSDVFAAGLQRAEAIGRQVVVETPDEQLNAAVGVSCAAIDALWTPPAFMHGVMAWRAPYIGWRSMFGATAYGWHDRVRAEVEFLAKAQITESKVTEHKANPKNGLTDQAADSCYHQGRGKIRSSNAAYQSGYEMQSQFFDQAIQDWRYTADPEMEKVLRPALELHLEWIKHCFDPDDDGVYESYMNTWPTDNQWYNGGGTAEESCYAYRGHAAALDMARRAGDEKARTFHQAQLEKIRQGFFRSLWIREKGHSGAYREQMGYKRLHEDPWLYSIFLPIDAGLLDEEQAASSLHFTEYGLERFKMPLGGERVITSNWIPGIRTVRYLHNGDVYHTALAYYQSGLPEGAWTLLAGVFRQVMFNGFAPGDCGGSAGIDFADPTQMLGRTIVEGLFGYQPDYPNGRVRLAPQFPVGWDHASIRTPDMALRFKRTNLIGHYEVELAKPAAMGLVLPAPTRQVSKVTLNGAPVKWTSKPGFGTSRLEIEVPVCQKAKLEVSFEDSLTPCAAVQLKAVTGEKLALTVPDARIVEFKDSQGVFSEAGIKEGSIVGNVSSNTGNHLVLALVEVGSQRQWREFKLHITDPAADARRQAKLLDSVPRNAQWECVDLGQVLNGDIRSIFKQQYLSPRPNTCSLRLAVDGFRTWMMIHYVELPAIDLARVPSLARGDDTIVTPQGVPFRAWKEDRNIAFTSQWDNWPRKVEIPIRKKGAALWLLVCGSTNPMQVRIANAELRMKYSDNVQETLALVPPDNYWNLCPIDNMDYKHSPFCLPAKLPETVQLGQNCRAMLLNWRLREGVELESVTLETLSQEVVVGLMGVSLMR